MRYSLPAHRTVLRWRWVRAAPALVSCHDSGFVSPPALFLRSGVGGQLEAGFTMTHLVEAPYHTDATARYMPGYFATRAVKQRYSL